MHIYCSSLVILNIMSTKYIVRLNTIPERMKVDLLAFKGIAKIEVVHKEKVPFFAETDVFLKKYIPAAKFNNKNFTFVHRLDDSVAVPTIRVFDKENKMRTSIETSAMTSVQILEMLKTLDAEYSKSLVI